MPTKTPSPKSLLTKALLLDAAARIAPEGYKGGEKFMCHAVYAAALGDNDAAEDEFSCLLVDHDVSTGGSLNHYDAEGVFHLCPYGIYAESPEAQAHRFDFLTLLAISGVR